MFSVKSSTLYIKLKSTRSTMFSHHWLPVCDLTCCEHRNFWCEGYAVLSAASTRTSHPSYELRLCFLGGVILYNALHVLSELVWVAQPDELKRFLEVGDKQIFFHLCDICKVEYPHTHTQNWSSNNMRSFEGNHIAGVALSDALWAQEFDTLVLVTGRRPLFGQWVKGLCFLHLIGVMPESGLITQQ